jgi:hypothetical protein
MYARILTLACLGLALSGCATIIEGTTQSVSVNTMPATGAKCKLQSSEGVWYVTTPGSVTVHKTKNNLDVSCAKDGFADASESVAPHFNGATVGNVLAGGLIGAGIDAASGANYTYPDEIDVPMKATAPQTASAPAPDSAHAADAASAATPAAAPSAAAAPAVTPAVASNPAS